MQEYNMAVAADPMKRKNVMPGSIARRLVASRILSLPLPMTAHACIFLLLPHSKLRYLSLELFGDLVPFLFGTFEFYTTVLLYMFALWMRIYVHYLSQYLYLLVSSISKVCLLYMTDKLSCWLFDRLQGLLSMTSD